MELIVDTNFVIALEREARRNKPGPARAFLKAHPEDRFFLTFTVAGELASGESASARRDWETLCRPYPILPWKEEVSWEYGAIYRTLRKAGHLIGTNDLWIAATARTYDLPLVTNNLAEFQRIPDLEILSFP